MAQTGYTPIQLYYSSTTTNVPLAANLANGELAINITDGKLFYKDNANAIQVIGWKVRPATAGGTGLTSFAVGDLIYANTTTTLASLADVATGNALISGGVSTAPAWGKIGLTTHVSGTLATGNGGTGLASYSQGDLLYYNSGTTLTALAKNTTASRYLSNSGASNNPAWAQIDLSNGVTGTLPVSNGGTGNTTGAATAVTSNSTSGVLQITGPAAASTRVATVPDANWTAARTDTGQTFTGNQVITGNTLIGVTSNILSARFVAAKNDANTLAFFSQDYSAGNADCVAFVNGFATGANAAVQCRFYNNALSSVGTITSSGSATAYNTSSDYRLKNTIAPMTGALAKVALLKPVTYKWNADGSDGEGFIAHELAEICPQAVAGEKDAVDTKGKPIYQGIDVSFLVATLTAAIQEQQIQIEALKVEVAALKN